MYWKMPGPTTTPSSKDLRYIWKPSTLNIEWQFSARAFRPYATAGEENRYRNRRCGGVPPGVF